MPEAHQKTKVDIPAWLAAAIVIGLFILGNVYNHYETARKNNSSKPFEATVISEKVSCYNKNCWQEFKAVSNSNEYLLSKNNEPWLVVGNTIKLVAVYEQSACIPLGRGGCTNDKHHFEIYKESK